MVLQEITGPQKPLPEPRGVLRMEAIGQTPTELVQRGDQLGERGFPLGRVADLLPQPEPRRLSIESDILRPRERGF